MDPGGGEFNFQHLPNYKFASVDKAEVKESLSKWSMSNGLRLQAYSFDKSFQKYNERDFVLSFFGCQNVLSTLVKATPARSFTSIGVPAELVKFSEVKCTMTNLYVFDKLQEEDTNIVRSNGSIVKCMPQYVSGEVDGSEHGFEMEVADNLRKLILADAVGSDANYDEFEDTVDVLTESEKKEFLVVLFSHLVIGGSLCQYEDSIEPYKTVTKLLYKDLVAVAREEEGDGDNDKLKVVSHIYKIHSLSNDCCADETGSTNMLFHRQYLNNFLYLIVNPLKQLCFTVYHHV